MKQALLFSALAGAMITAQAATVLNPSNGHYYEVVANPLSWHDAAAAASSSSYMGLSGHLATFTSSAENAWFTTTFGHQGDIPWIGLYQPPGSAEPTGGWTWVTGEAFVFNNWNAFEPNDAGGEDAAHLWGTGGASGQDWNDLASSRTLPYVVEYEAAVSTPDGGSTMLCLGGGLLTIAGLRNRRTR